MEAEMRSLGWVLDVYIEGGRAVLWIRKADGSILRLEDGYRPDLYAEPSVGVSPEDAASLLGSHPNIELVEVEERRCSIYSMERRRVLHIIVDRASNYRKVLRDLEGSGLLESLYNVDLLHVQRYLFTKGFAPASRVEVEHHGAELRRVEVLEDPLEASPPPFSTYIFSLDPGSDMSGWAVPGITLYDEDLKVKDRIHGDEVEVLRAFQEGMMEADPDILVSPSPKADLGRLWERCLARGISPQLGRERGGIEGFRRLRGRVALDLGFFEEYGLAGAAELSRFAFAPLGLSSRWPSGRIIDSRQCLEAHRRGILIPRRGCRVVHRTALEAIQRDRGGLVMAPEAGLHENVAELDYESMFPNIIFRENVSYETVGVSDQPPGLLGLVAEEPLRRRGHYKRMRRMLPRGSPEWTWCEQRQRALKMVLVCIYGYSGCFANRYGNLLAFEEVNRLARDRLIESVNIALSQGFKVVYADTDSIFVKRDGATAQDYEGLARLISSRVGLPISLDNHYRFIVFLRSRGDGRLEVAKRYLGRLMDGGLHCRGIGLRRRDTPPMVRALQEELMGILFDAGSSEEVLRFQVPRALERLRERCIEVMRGEADWRGLVISKALSRHPGEYRSRPPHLIAARQLGQMGVDVRAGDLVDFLYVEAGDRNPYRRVAPTRHLKRGWRGYDRRKYLGLILSAAEEVLGPLVEGGWDGIRRGMDGKHRATSLLEYPVSEEDEHKEGGG
jgi:DNA polymerase elongation subunit (family B)